MTLIETKTVDRDGCTFVVETHYDNDYGLPWEECDCYGIVSDVPPGGYLKPGEKPLADRSGLHYAYDVPASIQKAKDEGWCGTGHESAAQREHKIEQTVEHDYQRLLDFVEERWFYMGVVVYERLACCEACGHERTGEQASIWAVESDDDYYTSGAGLDELIEEAIQRTEAA